MAVALDQLDLVVHIGLHKTATTFIQNELSTHRYDLMQEGVLYPLTGQTVDAAGPFTREGAQSGHGMFTRGEWPDSLYGDLRREVPESTSTVLLSSENYTIWKRKIPPSQYVAQLRGFRRVQVCLVLRRQDTWIESYYKQLVDGHKDYETRSLAQFLAAEGPRLLDFHTRFTPWRDAVGAENFHVISYDDVADATDICRWLLGIAGVRGDILREIGTLPVPRYDSVRAIDTLGLRILNSYRVAERSDRVSLAKAIYAAAPPGDIELMSPHMRAGIQDFCAPINARIEEEWFDRPVRGFNFAQEPRTARGTEISADDLMRYVDDVIAICDSIGPRKDS
jgi:hypothetical protein